MTALRWTRRLLDALLVAAVLTVTLTAGITLLAPALGGRALVIGGGSMEPAIGRGALMLSLPAGAEGYASGDVVTVQQGASTPYTHRITRFADLRGVSYVETKGDANAEPDPAIVPVAAVIGRVALSLPLLGYLSLALGTAMGLAGFLALCAMLLLLVWLLEDLEEERCPVCATAAAAASGAVGEAAAAGGAALDGILSALPDFAFAGPPTRVRDRGRARDPQTPVILEADRRNPRRWGLVTIPEVPTAPEAATAPEAGTPRAMRTSPDVAPAAGAAAPPDMFAPPEPGLAAGSGELAA